MRMDCIEYSKSQDVAKIHNRKGECNSKKCRAACCRFSIVNTEYRAPAIEYFKHMGLTSETIAGKKYLILDKECKHLDLKTYKCRIYKRRPIPCRHFPIPSDIVYLRIANKCTFKFETNKKEIKTTPEGI